MWLSFKIIRTLQTRTTITYLLVSTFGQAWLDPRRSNSFRLVSLDYINGTCGSPSSSREGAAAALRQTLSLRVDRTWILMMSKNTSHLGPICTESSLNDNNLSPIKSTRLLARTTPSLFINPHKSTVIFARNDKERIVQLFNGRFGHMLTTLLLILIKKLDTKKENKHSVNWNKDKTTI